VDILSCLDDWSIAAATALDYSIRGGSRLDRNVGGGVGGVGGGCGGGGWHDSGRRYVEGRESGTVVIAGHQSGIRHERLRIFEYLAVKRMV